MFAKINIFLYISKFSPHFSLNAYKRLIKCRELLLYAKCNYITNPIYFQFPIGVELELNWSWIGPELELLRPYIKKRTRFFRFPFALPPLFLLSKLGKNSIPHRLWYGGTFVISVLFGAKIVHTVLLCKSHYLLIIGTDLQRT